MLHLNSVKHICKAVKQVVSEMATIQHKIFCIREFSKSEYVTAVQRAFRRKFNIQPPTRQSIYRWNKQFDETGFLRKGKRLKGGRGAHSSEL
jgi:hypothetical protein